MDKVFRKREGESYLEMINIGKGDETVLVVADVEGYPCDLGQQLTQDEYDKISPVMVKM